MKRCEAMGINRQQYEALESNRKQYAAVDSNMNYIHNLCHTFLMVFNSLLPEYNIIQAI